MIGDSGVDSIVIGEHTIRLGSHFVKFLSDALHVTFKELVLQAIQIRLHICGDPSD